MMAGSGAGDLRFEIGAHLVAQIDPEGSLGAAIVGSVGRGFADAYSDLELLLVWAEPPDDRVRDEIEAAWGARSSRRFTRLQRWFGVDNLEVRGFPIDVIHQTLAGIDETAAVVERDADLSGQEVLANLVTARWLRGGLPRPVYSDALAALTLERHVRPLPLGSAQIPALRGDRVRFADRCVRWAREIGIALHAANRRFWPGDRSVIEGIACLPHRPPDAEERLRAAMEQAPPDAVRTLAALMDDTLSLAAARVPAWMSAPVRERLGQVRRCRWTEEELQRWLAGHAIPPHHPGDPGDDPR
jgi:hypothetical protein